MRYYLSIGGKVFENVSDFKVSKEYRSESSRNNLGGDLLIDRVGKEKTAIKAKVNELSAEDMEYLRECRRKMDLTVQYYEGNVLKSKNMVIEPFTEPSPLYFYGKREEGMIYPSITLQLTEL